jgi:hypothetical protein
MTAAGIRVACWTWTVRTGRDPGHGGKPHVPAPVDSRTRYQGAAATATDLSEVPSVDGFYWYVVTGTAPCGIEGPAGSSRVVNSSGVCPWARRVATDDGQDPCGRIGRVRLSVGLESKEERQ